MEAGGRTLDDVRHNRILEESVIELVISRYAPEVYTAGTFCGMADVIAEDGRSSHLELQFDSEGVSETTPWTVIAEELHHRLEKDVCIVDDDRGLTVWATSLGTVSVDAVHQLALDTPQQFDSWLMSAHASWVRYPKQVRT